MGVPSKAHAVQLVKIQPGERLATTSELTLTPSLVTGCCEAKGMGYWAATQVKGLSPEITIVTEADTLHFVEGRMGNTVKGEVISTPSGSETVARCQKDSMGTREAQGIPQYGVCSAKSISGKVLQMTLWKSDQLVVTMKQGNACGGKELERKPLGRGHILRTQRRDKDVNKTLPITYFGREVSLKSRMPENCTFGSVREV